MHMLHTHNQRSLCHTQAYTLIHALTLFTLPRYSSPSLHRANTSSPSLTPPILRKETERGERAGLMWNGNPIYSLNTLLPLLTEGFMAPAFRLLLRQAGFSAKGLKSPPLHPPPFRLEHSDSLYPPQWKMRVSTQPESKTNDYCTHQIHIHTQKKKHCMMTTAIQFDWMSKDHSAATWNIFPALCCCLPLSQHLKNLNRCIKWLCRHYLCTLSICSSACTQVKTDAGCITVYVAFCESEGNQTNFAESWPVKGTCQVELLSVGVTVIPGQVGHEMPSSAVGLRCPITASSDAQPACLQKVDDVHVCPCLCQAPVCVSQAVSEEGEEEEEEGGLTVRPSLSLVCPSSAVPFRHVPVAFALNPPSPSPPTDAIKAGLSEQHRNQAARDAIIPASRSLPTCCDADIKHQDRVGGRYW